VFIFEEYMPYPPLDRSKVAKCGPDGRLMRTEKGVPIEEDLDPPLAEGNKQQFIRRLRLMKAYKYDPPHANRLYSKKNERDEVTNESTGKSVAYSGVVGELSAEIAFLLVENYSNAKPVTTDGSLWPTVAGLLYDIALPSRDGTPPKLVRACNVVVRRRKQRGLGYRLDP
jgi:hypothetical protein